MARGRPRKPDDTIPPHIDAEKLPRGVYWRPQKGAPGKGCWWIYEPHPEGGRQRARTIASETAVLSELHALAEGRDNAGRGTVRHVFNEFLKSTEFASLEAGTQKVYRGTVKAILEFRTKMGTDLGSLPVDRLSIPAIQRIIEVVAKGTDKARGMPTKANHMLRLMRRTFAWGTRFGHCKTNPAAGVKGATEAGEFKMPTLPAFAKALAYAKAHGKLTAHAKGSLSPYLASVMEIAYAVRLRGIEVTTLTDAHALPEGIRSNRRKGSLDTITRWTPRLRAAWDDLAALRKEAIERTRRPVPMKPEQRFLIVSESGTALTKSALDSAWQRFMARLIKEGVLTTEERFSLHGLKHRGVTDTKGTRADKKDASGHKSDAAFGIYAHDLAVVEPAGEG